MSYLKRVFVVYCLMFSDFSGGLVVVLVLVLALVSVLVSALLYGSAGDR